MPLLDQLALPTLIDKKAVEILVRQATGLGGASAADHPEISEMVNALRTVCTQHDEHLAALMALVQVSNDTSTADSPSVAATVPTPSGVTPEHGATPDRRKSSNTVSDLMHRIEAQFDELIEHGSSAVHPSALTPSHTLAPLPTTTATTTTTTTTLDTMTTTTTLDTMTSTEAVYPVARIGKVRDWLRDLIDGRTSSGEVLRLGSYTQLDPGWSEALVVWMRNYTRYPLLKRFPNTPVTFGMSERVRLGILGDWGTGVFGDADVCAFTRVGQHAAAQQYDINVHLGDVYYAGTEREERAKFLDHWPVAGTANFALNSNHEVCHRLQLLNIVNAIDWMDGWMDGWMHGWMDGWID
jgi:hypothetical protein